MPQPKRLAVKRLKEITGQIVLILFSILCGIAGIGIAIGVLFLAYSPLIALFYLLNKLIDKI